MRVWCVCFTEKRESGVCVCVCVCFPEEQEGAREAVTCSNLFTPGAVSPKLSGGVQGLGGARRARLVAGETLSTPTLDAHAVQRPSSFLPLFFFFFFFLITNCLMGYF